MDNMPNWNKDDLERVDRRRSIIEEQRKRVEGSIAELIDDLYKSHLRAMQGQMHLCAAGCCADQKGTLDSVQGCIENCTAPLVRANDIVQHELGQFQGRLQHCIMQCNDDARGRMTKLEQNDATVYQYQFERCTKTCVDRHLSSVPRMMKTIKEVLARGPEVGNAPMRTVSNEL